MDEYILQDTLDSRLFFKGTCLEIKGDHPAFTANIENAMICDEESADLYSAKYTLIKRSLGPNYVG